MTHLTNRIAILFRAKMCPLICFRNPGCCHFCHKKKFSTKSILFIYPRETWKKQQQQWLT